MGLIPQGLLCACLKIRASGKQLENEVLRAQITPCQSPLHKPHLHRADTESLQWHQGKPLICVLWEHYLCLSSQGALAQIFLPSCSLSLQETSKTPQHLQPQPYMGHLLTSLQSSRDSLALRCCQNPQKYAKPGSVESVFDSLLSQGCCLPWPWSLCPASSVLFLWGELRGLGRREWGRHLSENRHRGHFAHGDIFTHRENETFLSRKALRVETLLALGIKS